MEVGLERFTQVVNAIVRLHNFCRERLVQLERDDVCRTFVPAGVSVDDNGEVDSSFFETHPYVGGRPASDQASLSGPREMLRQHLEIRGMGRPDHNIARNRSR